MTAAGQPKYTESCTRLSNPFWASKLWVDSCQDLPLPPRIGQTSRMTTIMPRGYRSTTEHYFDEEQTEAIVRTTAYHRRDYCLSVIWFSPREHVDIRLSIATPFQRTSNVGVGSLDRLPLELLFDTGLRKPKPTEVI
ncbi:cyclin f-box [Penicillium digitatum]|uniref:Cyclin f-box n=1 Tax=Penicillium digitatum TaxID=36651 RepID=A0A7T7BKJ9_PENDI|nr:cyclin f-box [Penicillium digitatum]